MEKRQENQDINRIRKRITLRELLLPIGLMIGMVAVSFIVMLFLTQAERVNISEPLYQYVFTEKEVYSNGISMKADEEKITIDNGMQTYETIGYPFYYMNSDQMVLSDDFLWLDTEGNILGCMGHFAKIGPLEGGFLHNGGDVYIFMESTKLTFNKKSVTIPAFSYVACLQGDSLLICPYGSKAIFEELTGDGATAELEGGVIVNLAEDTFIRQNGMLNLLFTNPTVFEPVEGGK